MNTNEFRRHLASIHNVLNSPQRHLYEEAEEAEEVEEIEEIEVEEEIEEDRQIVLNFLESYFGDELTEDTSDDDINSAILELNITCGAVNEFFEVDEGFLSSVGKAVVGGAAAYGAYKGGKKLYKMHKDAKAGKEKNAKPEAKPEATK